MSTSLVGVGGIFHSNDRTATHAGAGTTGTAYVSRPDRWGGRGDVDDDIGDDDGENGVIDPERPNDPRGGDVHEGTYGGLIGRSAVFDEVPRKGETEEEKNDRMDRQLTDLARRMSRTQSEIGSTYEKNPFEATEDSELDVHSTSFKPRAWIKSVLHLRDRDPSHGPMRTAGFSFRNLNVHGFGSATDYQKTVSNIWLGVFGTVSHIFGLSKQRRIDILTNLDGVVYPGELLVVLGPPGSGCSTFLKTISGETHGFFVDDTSEINYQGITPKEMHSSFRGEAIYTAEVDVHFPNMTVGQTLAFAARARAPRHIPGGIPRKVYANYLRDATMAIFGISHTLNTKVGNDFVRGVSGGERKRVTIAEAALSGAPLQCWDNSTRGLDSANAVEFCKTLRMSAELVGSTAAVAIYQAPQSAYDVFDKVLVLYEGRQIYFGRTTDAKNYFVNLGFWCPDRQTDADFLTSMTSHQERIVCDGYEGRVPRSPDEFAAAWKASKDYAALQTEIAAFDQTYPIGGASLQQFKESHKAQQAKGARSKSPYILSYGQQIMLCLDRGFQRLISDPSLTLTQLFGNTAMALIVASVFYNLQPNTASFFSRGALLFFAILLNAFGSALEILTLYAQRNIVEKHARYAFYHPSAEAWASILTDMPYKIINSILFNITIYFMTNLRRTAGHFFFFYLVSFLTLLGMSMLFRTIASCSRTLSQAMTPAAILILALVIYTGFALPVPYMRGWARWINYLDLVGYSFESLMINEFYGRVFECSTFIPSGAGYMNVAPIERICSATSAVAGQTVVDGGAYIASTYQYQHSHKWRNVGIIIAFTVGLCCTYIAATELISAKKSKGEVLLFRRGHVGVKKGKTSGDDDVEATTSRPVEHQLSKEMSAVIAKQTAIFSWQDVTYDIKIKGEERRILDHVDGWVKPGTLTALMGVSGAGKTTLLDVLATRVTMGVVGGEMLVDGRQRDASFQRKTGYVQQQDLHLETSTVREALAFSALLRQPAHVSKKEKLDYVEDVIKLLDMQEYADAVVGVPGEGLNVEQRKRLTIGVELAAKPQLLLFLDEPTSGLDSQTSWAICDLMEKLTKNGQAILCTIHQPSAMLFQRFDRLLFLAKGGRTVYFGQVGDNSHILTSYFERNGAFPCPKEANPAEWMLEVIGAAPGSHSDIDWHETWKASPERVEVRRELAEMKEVLSQTTKPAGDPNDKAAFREFAAPFGVQLWEVQKRVFAQYWRTPSYIYSKLSLCTLAALFIGFSFYNAGTSQQALQNQLFAIFSLFTIFGQLVQQILPHFVIQRALYEARERPSKTYSWKAFMISNLVVELPWNAFAGLIVFFCFYYPVSLYKNAVPAHQVHERGALFFLLVEQFLLFTSTFSTMIIAAIDTAETAGNIGNLLFSLTLIFCGVLAAPGAFPQFWIFMYRVSPFTYLADSLLSTGLANTNVVCSANEILRFSSPAGQTCQSYLQSYINSSGGYLVNPQATGTCEFCAIADTNVFLSAVSSNYANRWRNFGILWAFIVFNGVAAVGLYWLARVPKNGGKREKKSKGGKQGSGVVGGGDEKGVQQRVGERESGDEVSEKS